MRLLLIPLVVAAFTAQALAQALPPPSRTVYKCDIDDKTVYSDAPCLGAKRVDVQPTRGLNKSSGKERVGHDVRAEQHSEQMAEALRPILGETAQQRAVRHRRARLAPEQARTCYKLDDEMAAAESRERTAVGAERKDVQSRLFELRRSYHRLRC